MNRLAAMLLAVLAVSQSAVSAQTTLEMVRAYEHAFAGRAYTEAGRLWRKIYTQSPRTATQLDFNLAVLTDPGQPDAGTLDTLISLYETFGPSSPDMTPAYLQRRATVGVGLPDEHAGLQLRWGLEALEAYPDGELDYLVGSVAGYFAPAYVRGQVDREQLIRYWLRMDRYLLLQELQAGTTVADVRRRLILRQSVIEILGGCSGMVGMKAGREALLARALCPQTIAYRLDPESVQELLYSGYAMRTLVAESLERGKIEEARDRLLAGSNMETNVVLKSDMLVQAAEMEKVLKRYRPARSLLRQARQLTPNRPEPYLEMARLYLESLDECKFSAFEKKAVYWLALDELRDISERLSEPDPAIRETIARYRKSAPTADEIRFMGLRLGDTYPINCWMRDVTTVR